MQLITTSKERHSVLLDLSKWILWFGMTCGVVFYSLYLTAWRLHIIKYACMQEHTPTMHNFGSFVHHPFTGIAINLSLLLACLSFAQLTRDVLISSNFKRFQNWILGR